MFGKQDAGDGLGVGGINNQFTTDSQPKTACPDVPLNSINSPPHTCSGTGPPIVRCMRLRLLGSSRATISAQSRDATSTRSVLSVAE